VGEEEDFALLHRSHTSVNIPGLANYGRGITWVRGIPDWLDTQWAVVGWASTKTHCVDERRRVKIGGGNANW